MHFNYEILFNKKQLDVTSRQQNVVNKISRNTRKNNFPYTCDVQNTLQK